MTGRPAALAALALASTAIVADSVMAEIRAETRRAEVGDMPPWSHQRPGRRGHPGRPGRFDAGGAGTYTAESGEGSLGCRGMPVTVHAFMASWTANRTLHRAVAQLARVPVSKTGGWGFESLLPCVCGP